MSQLLAAQQPALALSPAVLALPHRSLSEVVVFSFAPEPGSRALAAQSRTGGNPVQEPPIRGGLRQSLGSGRLGALFDGRLLSLPAPVVAERGAFELYADIDRLYASLAAIHDLEQRPSPGTDRSTLDGMKRDFLRALDSLLGAIPIGAGAQADFSAVSGQLKELRLERERLLKAIRDELSQQRWRELEASNQAAIALNDRILKAQLQAARMMLMGQSGLGHKALRRNAALWTFAGAANSAAAQRAELRYQANMQHAARVFVIPSGEVSITQARWINVLRVLDIAGRDLRNGRKEQAQARVDLLARVYALRPSPVAGGVSLRRYELLAAELRGLSDRIAGVRGPNAPPDTKEAIAVISRDLAALKSRIPHPKLNVPAGVLYKDPDVAKRSQGHTLDSIHAEHALISRHIANLEYHRDLLASRPLAGGELQSALADLAVLREWAGRGLVRSKQLAQQHLETAVSSLERGDWPLARRYLGRVLDELKGRLEELERMAGHVRRRGALL